MPLFFTIPFLLFAQTPEFNSENKMTDEQRSVLQAKTMKLKLDLTDVQETQLQTVLLEHFQSRPKRPENPRQLSQDARYTLRMKQLEHAESLQKNLKKILTETQYKSFREKQKDNRMAALRRGRIKAAHRARHGRPMPHRRH